MAPEAISLFAVSDVDWLSRIHRRLVAPFVALGLTDRVKGNSLPKGCKAISNRMQNPSLESSG